MPMLLPGPGRLLTFTPEPSVPGTHTGNLNGRFEFQGQIITESSSGSSTATFAPSGDLFDLYFFGL